VSKEKIKVMDWLVHGGHQYEFFKTGPTFFCTKLDSKPPREGDFGRPALSNRAVRMVASREKSLLANKFDIIMIRAGVAPQRYNMFQRGRRAIPGIAVVQTVSKHPDSSFPIPSWAKVVVWNSKKVMDENYKNLPGKKHFYIPHGFDSSEFCSLNMPRNGRILTVASVFQKRGSILGFKDWKHVSDKTGLCDLVGHGDEGLRESVGTFSLDKLVKKYNEYSVFLNTTKRSAMPRSRAEALMCGTPLVTTNNYGIDKYLVNNKSCIFADTKYDMLRASNKILRSKQMQQDLGSAGREAAINHFGIKEYIDRWEGAFFAALR
jgi:glycosyltransferase involved in cell wall biosynthesis